MKGHRKKQCVARTTLETPDGVYVGTVYDGKPSGRGRLSSDDVVYEGEFEAGVKQGEGTSTHTNGTTYTGAWRNDKYHGPGRLCRYDGVVYDGYFYSGKFHGHGVYSSEEIVYDGQWCHGARHGHGTLTNADGVYEGHFYYQLRHGQGTFTDNDGNVYSGRWRRDVRDGKGIYTSSNGTYTGDWSQNKYHGHGTWVSKTNGTYHGQWKRGRRHNHGVQTDLDGTTYRGGWFKGMRTGHGSCSWASGATFEGVWSRNERSGHGRLTDEEGHIFVGVWSGNMRRGEFVEVHPSGYSMTGPWVNDVRHGTFEDSRREKWLYLWNQRIVFETEDKARVTAQRMLARKDVLGARAVVEWQPEILNWTFLFEFDHKGHLLEFVNDTDALTYFREHAWMLYKLQRYVFLERLVERWHPEWRTRLSEQVPELFDALSHDFVANPWVVRNVSYSKRTRARLLEGLHLGELGRCPPKDPFTRTTLTKKSGRFLHKRHKLARSVYQRAVALTKQEPAIEDVATTLHLQDFQVLINNATAANDIVTIRQLLRERDAFVRSRSSSVESAGSQ